MVLSTFRAHIFPGACGSLGVWPQGAPARSPPRQAIKSRLHSKGRQCFMQAFGFWKQFRCYFLFKESVINVIELRERAAPSTVGLSEEPEGTLVSTDCIRKKE